MDLSYQGQGRDEGRGGHVANLALDPDRVQLVLLEHLLDYLHVVTEHPVLLRKEEALLAVRLFDQVDGGPVHEVPSTDGVLDSKYDLLLFPQRLPILN